MLIDEHLWLTHLFPMFSFDSPWKYQGSFSHVFREDEKETIEKNVLNDKLCIISIICLLPLCGDFRSSCCSVNFRRSATLNKFLSLFSCEFLQSNIFTEHLHATVPVISWLLKNLVAIRMEEIFLSRFLGSKP